MGYHLDVITDDVGEAIRYAGGLMFDCCRAGWQVVVTTDDVAHTEALAILGVRAQSPVRSAQARRFPRGGVAIRPRPHDQPADRGHPAPLG